MSCHYDCILSSYAKYAHTISHQYVIIQTTCHVHNAIWLCNCLYICQYPNPLVDHVCIYIYYIHLTYMYICLYWHVFLILKNSDICIDSRSVQDECTRAAPTLAKGTIAYQIALQGLGGRRYSVKIQDPLLAQEGYFDII